MAHLLDVALYIRMLGIGILRLGPIRCHPFSLALDSFLLLFPCYSFYLIHLP